jgi:hypothetical protein
VSRRAVRAGSSPPLLIPCHHRLAPFDAPRPALSCLGTKRLTPTEMPQFWYLPSGTPKWSCRIGGSMTRETPPCSLVSRRAADRRSASTRRAREERAGGLDFRVGALLTSLKDLPPTLSIDEAAELCGIRRRAAQSRSSRHISRERRRRDSNPRDVQDAYQFSRLAPSTRLGHTSGSRTSVGRRRRGSVRAAVKIR